MTRRGIAGWVAAASWAALVHGVADAWVLGARAQSPLFGPGDAAFAGIFTIGLLAALALVAALALGVAAWGASVALPAPRASRPRWALALVAALAATPLWVLNGHILRVSPAAYAGGLGVGTASLAALAWLLAGPRRPRTRVAAGLVLLAASGVAFAANALLYRGLYRPQHASLTLAALGLSAWGVGLVAAAPGPRWRRRVRALGWTGGVLAGLLGLQALVVLPDTLDQTTRGLLSTGTVEATHALDALGLVGDLDGDGVPALLGGGDCAPWDAAVHQGAQEILDDGVDQDCLGGDARAADLAALIAARGAPAPPALRRDRPKRVVVITVDALRADRLDRMPSALRLAARGVRFTRAYSAYPSTILSMYAMQTGRPPGAVRTRPFMDKWDLPTPDTAPTVAESFAQAGYETVGLFFHHLFRPGLGLSRGFQRVWTASGEDRVVVWGRSARQSADRAIAALDQADAAGRALFLWVHFYDPHEPYVLHPEIPVDPDDLTARYDGEVAWVDRHLRRLVARLEAGGVLDAGVVLFTADHGESLGEHGRRFHHSALDDVQLRVPLVVVAPGGQRGGVRAVPVSLLDLGATLLDLAGLPPLAGGVGRSFAGALAPGWLDDTLQGLGPVFSDLILPGDRQRAVVTRLAAPGGRAEASDGAAAGPEDWKLIFHQDRGFFELYDLTRDPGERANVYDLAGAQAARLERWLGLWAAWRPEQADEAHAAAR